MQSWRWLPRVEPAWLAIKLRHATTCLSGSGFGAAAFARFAGEGW
jgi:hypothetical protein